MGGNLKAEKGKLLSRKCDMRNESEIRLMFSWIETHPELGKVNVCINNAGLSTAETLSEGTMESWRQMMDVNVLALCLCTQLSVQSMKKHGVDDGQIVMISSFSGHRVPPNPSTRFYAATKFAVTGLLEGWRQEMRDPALLKPSSSPPCTRMTQLGRLQSPAPCPVSRPKTWPTLWPTYWQLPSTCRYTTF